MSEATVMLSYEIELLVRKVSHKDAPDMTCAELTCNLKEKVIQQALTDDNIQFHWCLLTTDIEDKKATIILKNFNDYGSFRNYQRFFICEILYGTV